MAGDLPDFFTASGWQDADDKHLPGEGVPGRARVPDCSCLAGAARRSL